MIKQMAWNTFKNTGNIDTFMELVEVENIEKKLNENKLQDNVKVKEYGELQNKGNNIIGK
ncbi:MAG: YqzL family protein [Clostridia bacterium]|nr:YqzL family protein [Clostridia bacterium]